MENSYGSSLIYPVVQRVFTKLSQGQIRQTGNLLDLAVEGRGFKLDVVGFPVNELGYRVLDSNLNEIRLEGQLNNAIYEWVQPEPLKEALLCRSF